MQAENKMLSTKVETLTKKIDRLENQSRRENLVFHGLNDSGVES